MNMIDYENLGEVEVNGTVFKDRAFRYEHTINLHEFDDVDDVDKLYAEYEFMYEIGVNHKTSFKY